MKKLFFICAVIGSLIAIAKNSNTTPQPINEDMSTIEATAGCEISSNPALNQGFCQPLTGSSGDACVGEGFKDSVRCSGNTH